MFELEELDIIHQYSIYFISHKHTPLHIPHTCTHSFHMRIPHAFHTHTLAAIIFINFTYTHVHAPTWVGTPKKWPGDEFFKLRKSKFWEPQIFLITSFT